MIGRKRSRGLVQILFALLPCVTLAWVPSKLSVKHASAWRPSLLSLGVSLNRPETGTEDDESGDDRNLLSGSEAIKFLQKAFFQDEKDKAVISVLSTGVIRDLPLWRVEWTELPGFQNVLNVAQPHCTQPFPEVPAFPISTSAIFSLVCKCCLKCANNRVRPPHSLRCVCSEHFE